MESFLAGAVHWRAKEDKWWNNSEHNAWCIDRQWELLRVECIFREQWFAIDGLRYNRFERGSTDFNQQCSFICHSICPSVRYAFVYCFCYETELKYFFCAIVMDMMQWLLYSNRWQIHEAGKNLWSEWGSGIYKCWCPINLYARWIWIVAIWTLGEVTVSKSW